MFYVLCQPFSRRLSNLRVSFSSAATSTRRSSSPMTRTSDARVFDVYRHGPPRESADSQPRKHTRPCHNSIKLSIEQCRCRTCKNNTPITRSSPAVCRLPSRHHLPSRDSSDGWRRADWKAVQQILDDSKLFRPPPMMTSMTSTSCS